MKDQVKKYYYIDRKLVSSEPSEVLEGLNDINLFINQLTISDIFNSIIMRLIDLFNNLKQCSIRKKISHILIRLANIIQYLPSKDEFVNNIYKNLKSSDEILRILSMDILQKTPKLFAKQNSVYHFLLSKLKMNDNCTLRQKVGVIKCLKYLLSSQNLAKHFSQNITQLYEIGQIPLKYLLFLSLYANIQPINYPKVLMTFWKILKINKQSKSVYKYFRKFIIISINKNFKTYLLFQKHLSQKFPEIQQKIKDIKFMNYLFLQSHIQLFSQSNQNLLDMAYQIKKSNNIQYLTQISEIMSKRIHRYLQKNENQLQEQYILMSFYCTSNFDDRFKKRLRFINQNKRIKFLKMLLVTYNMNSAYVLIEQEFKNFHTKYQALIVLKTYVQFCLNLSQDLNFLISLIKTISQQHNLSELLILSQKWKQLYLKGHQQDMQIQRQSVQINSQIVIDCQEQIQAIESQDSTILPMKIRYSDRNFIYFGKNIIIGLINQRHKI